MTRSTPETWSWCLLALLNRSLQFAVPAFLFVSAYVNGCSLRRDPDLGRFARRRAVSAGVPYLLASALGIALGLHRHAVAWRQAPEILLTGRAFTHLYFMILLFQMYAALPWLVALIRPRTSIVRPLLWSTLAQVVVYGAHWLRPDLGYLQSSLLWYLLPVVLGAWLSGSPEQIERLTAAWPAASVVAYLFYAPLAVAALVMPVNGTNCQISEWMYTTSAALALACLGAKLGNGAGRTSLDWLGKRSMGIYLLHPLAMQILDRFLQPSIHLWPPVTAACYFWIGLGVSLACVTVGRSRSSSFRQAAPLVEMPAACVAIHVHVPVPPSATSFIEFHS